MKLLKIIAALALAAAITALSAWADEEIDSAPAAGAAQARLIQVGARGHRLIASTRHAKAISNT